MILHFVLFIWKEGVSHSQIEALTRAMGQLPKQIPELLSIEACQISISKRFATFHIEPSFSFWTQSSLAGRTARLKESDKGGRGRSEKSAPYPQNTGSGALGCARFDGPPKLASPYWAFFAPAAGAGSNERK